MRKERIETKRGNEGGKWKEVKLKFLKSFLSRLVFAIATFPYMSIHSIVAFFCIHSRGKFCKLQRLGAVGVLVGGGSRFDE